METEEQPNLIQRLINKVSGKEVTALGGEIGTGIGLDMATQKLLYGGPKGWAAYGVINFAGGAASNYAAQQYRTEEDLAWYDRDWGEIISSGLLGIIPGTTAEAGKFTRFVGNPNTYRRVATFGAAQGITDQFIRQGIDQGRLPTAGEIATGGITGSVAGPVFKKSFDEIGKIFTKYRGKSAEEINSLMTDRERSSISYFKKQIVANRDNPEAVLELIERMKESNFNYRKNVLGLHKNFKDYATFRDSKEQITNRLNDKIDGIDPSDAYERDLTRFYANENVQFPVRVLDEVPQDIRSTMAWESGLVDGVFDFDRWLSKSLYGKRFRSRTTVAKMQAAYGTDVNFETYRDNVLLPQFIKEWGPILDKLKIPRSSLQAHHIFAIRASAGLYDGLQFGSKEWVDVTNTLLKKYIRPGDMPKNLMPLVGSTADKNTPHYITHRYIDEIIGPTGETFFTKEVRKEMKKNHKFRIKKTLEFAEKMKTAEGVAVQAQKVWDRIYGPGQVIPEELVEELSALPMQVNPKYRTDVKLEELVRQVFSQIKEFPFPESMSRKEFLKNWLPQFEGKGFEALRRMFEIDLDLTPEQAMETPLGYRLQKYLQTNKVKNRIKKKVVKRKKK